jgi:hypothetical protein
MKNQYSFWIIILTLLAASSSHAWQNPAGNIQGNNLPASIGAPVQGESQIAPQGIHPDPNQQSTGHYQPPQRPQGANSQDGWPNYPYPQYLNPYYEDAPTRNFLTDAVDWVVAVPSNLMGNFFDFLDRRVFPLELQRAAQGATRLGAS